MKEEYFVNFEFDSALKDYFSNGEHNFNDYYVIVNALVFIYGDIDIYNPYLTGNKSTMILNLCKFGMPRKDVLDFIELVSNFQLNGDYCDEIPKKLIDMLRFKKNYVSISKDDGNNFQNIILNFSRCNKDLIVEYLKENNIIDLQTEIKNDNKIIVDSIVEKSSKKKKIFEFAIPSSILESSSGNISILIILITIAIVLFGVAIVNIIAG